MKKKDQKMICFFHLKIKIKQKISEKKEPKKKEAMCLLLSIFFLMIFNKE